MIEADRYYHVRITCKSSRWDDEIKLDLTRDSLIERFIKSYEYGTSIIVNGKTVDVFDIERIKINKTEKPSSILIPEIKARRARSSVVVAISDEWYVTDEGEDVTDNFITGPPGYRKINEKIKHFDSETMNQISNEIFIVHGHDEEMKQTVARVIEKLDLKPIILHEQANKGKTIIEKFESHSNDVSFAIVLLSPDDKGSTVDSSPDDTKFRARQNVILELGYFIGKLGRDRVLVLHKNSSNFELPSDILGVLYTPYDSNWKFELVRELLACDYEVDANKIL